MENFGVFYYFTSSVLLCICSLLCVKFPLALTAEFYADNGLQQTVILQVPGREKKEMKQEILTLLGLHHRPKPKGHGTDNSPAMFMLKLYNTLTNEVGGCPYEENDIHFHCKLNLTFGSFVQPINKSDVIMSFINHASKIGFLRHERDRTFYFDFSEVTHQESLVSGKLRIYKEVSRRPKKGECEIQLYMIRQGMDPEDKTLDSEFNLTVSTDYEGWLTFNVTRASESWTDFPSTNLGLYMTVRDNAKGREIDPNKFGLVGRKGPEEKQPFMVGFFKVDDDIHIRRTRSTSRKHATSPEDIAYSDSPGYTNGRYSRIDSFRVRPCQKRTLYVSFKDLGWQDWIIAPDGYSAYYCFGECSFPLGSHMNATNHAIVQTLVHLINPATPRPCCAPTKLGAQSVLYFDQNSNVVLKKYKNMVVKTCGCH